MEWIHTTRTEGNEWALGLRKSGELLGQLRKMTLYKKWTSFSYNSWTETCCDPVINLFRVVNFIEHG